MRYLSVCSGIEAATVAWHPLGWHPVAFSEIEAFPSAVLQYHYPHVPNLGDMTKFSEWPDADVDVLVGGTPCQSFSVVGLRAGLADPRGNLMLTYGAIARRYRPRWLVWENVPGVLSSGGGRDFGSFLGLLVELGYGWAYRVLDARFFGVAQRRRRVFVVGHLGDWRRAAAVLFERHSLQGHPAPRREARERPATTIAARTRGGGGLGTDFDCDGGLIESRWPCDVAPTLNAHFGDKQGLEDQHALNGAGMFVPVSIGNFAKRDTTKTLTGNTGGGGETQNPAFVVSHSLRADGFDASEDGTGRGTPLVPVAFHNRQGPDISGDVTHPLGAQDNGMAVAFDTAQITSKTNRSQPSSTCHTLHAGATHHVMIPSTQVCGLTIHGTDRTVQRIASYDETAQCLRSRTPGNIDNSSTTVVQHSMQVRRLTPVECERLQGFPDGYTAIPWRGKAADQCPDGPRYKALGNSMAVPVMRWIGRRIAAVEELQPLAADCSPFTDGDAVVEDDRVD